MGEITLIHYFILSAVLFCIGLYGVLTRRNGIAVFMSIELMFNAVNINFIASSYASGSGFLTGQIFPFFIIAVAAAEVTIGLALMLAVYRAKASVNLEDISELKG